MNGSIHLISSTSPREWLEALDQTVAYDFYHLPFYHDLARDTGEGEPCLVVYSNEGYRVLLPLLVREIKDMPAPFNDGRPWYDATSVYGYPGPLTSHAEMPAGVVAGFQEKLTKALLEMRVISIFSRLHPFLDQRILLSGLGSLVHQGHTVSIDLSAPEAAQVSQYRENHRRDIRKLRARGARCLVDEDYRYLDTFVEQYCATMDRVGAWDNYRFPSRYFRQFVASREAEVKLLECQVDGEIVGSGLFVKCQGILEYHLGGTSSAGQSMGAMKFLLDAARHWGYENGAKVLHLGGGVGSRDDSLSKFKIGFSRRTHSFRTWQWGIRQDVYDALVALRRQQLLAQGSHPSPSFFPAYRAPALLEQPLESSPSMIENPEGSHDGRPEEAQPRPEPGTTAQPVKTGGGMTNRLVKKRLLILGAGGHARVIADAILTRMARAGAYELVGYLDDDPHLLGKNVLGKPVCGSLADLDRIPHDAVVVGIGDNETRSRLFRELKDQGETFATVIHPQAIVAHDVKIGKGTVAFAGAIVNTGSVIGDNVILNTGCSVDHNCAVGSHAHICPRTSLGGGVIVGEGVFLGINSTVIHGKQIGPWATVGGGAAVIKDVPPHLTVVGVPARALPPRGVPHKPDTRDLISERIESVKEFL